MSCVVGVDPGLRDIARHNEDGLYIDNTAIAPVVWAVIEGPLPGACGLSEGDAPSSPGRAPTAEAHAHT